MCLELFDNFNARLLATPTNRLSRMAGALGTSGHNLGAASHSAQLGIMPVTLWSLPRHES